MKRVYIGQVLCPKRHCMLAMAGEFEEEEQAQLLGPMLRAKAEQGINSGVFRPVCGLCNAPYDSFAVEVGLTKFENMEEALPLLKAQAGAQRAIAELMESLHLPPDQLADLMGMFEEKMQEAQRKSKAAVNN